MEVQEVNLAADDLAWGDMPNSEVAEVVEKSDVEANDKHMFAFRREFRRSCREHNALAASGWSSNSSIPGRGPSGREYALSRVKTERRPLLPAEEWFLQPTTKVVCDLLTHHLR